MKVGAEFRVHENSGSGFEVTVTVDPGVQDNKKINPIKVAAAAAATTFGVAVICAVVYAVASGDLYYLRELANKLLELTSKLVELLAKK